MNASENFCSLSLPLGRFLGTRIRVSAVVLIAVLAVAWRVQEITISLLFTAVLLLSVLLSEITHLWLSHRMALRCHERILWPFGGLYVEAPRMLDPFISLAGPGVNSAIAFVAASQLDIDAEIPMLMTPATCWQGLHSENTLTLLLRISFLVNTLIAVANLIPVRPMAAGYVLQNLLFRRFSEIETRDLMLRSGLVLGIFGLLAGFVFDLSGLAALSAFLLLLHVQEAVQWFAPPVPETGFNRYGSTNRYGETGSSEVNADESIDDDDIADSVIDRWKNRRASERDLREQELEQCEHDELDRVLEKLHILGRDALTIAELHLLNRVSARLRQKNHQ